MKKLNMTKLSGLVAKKPKDSGKNPKVRKMRLRTKIIVPAAFLIAILHSCVGITKHDIMISKICVSVTL